jgi:hypothetical protein
MSELKLFKCTVECKNNGCYVETLLIVAENESDAHNQLVESRRDKYTEKPHIKYTCKLERVSIDLTKKGITKVGFGESERDYGGDD